MASTGAFSTASRLAVSTRTAYGDRCERRPAIFTLRMLDGMVNAGRFECGGVPVLVLLEQVASSSMAEPEVRRNAAEILQYCRTRVGE